MAADASAPARPRWQRILFQLALSVPELGVAYGFGFAVFVGAMALGCRLLGASVCDSAGALAIVVVALGASVVAGAAYWIAALAFGLAGWRRLRYGLDGVATVIAAATIGTLYWQDYSEQAAARAAAATARRNEQAAREAWIAALRQNPDGHAPPGVVPPMLRVVDSELVVEVTNTTDEWLTVALAHVLEDRQGVWRACPLLTTGEVSDYYRFSIGPGRTARYAAVPDCAAGFAGLPLEYRVGDPFRDKVGFWSDSAFATPEGRLP